MYCKSDRLRQKQKEGWCFEPQSRKTFLGGRGKEKEKWQQQRSVGLGIQGSTTSWVTEWGCRRERGISWVVYPSRATESPMPISQLRKQRLRGEVTCKRQSSDWAQVSQRAKQDAEAAENSRVFEARLTKMVATSRATCVDDRGTLLHRARLQDHSTTMERGVRTPRRPGVWGNLSSRKLRKRYFLHTCICGLYITVVMGLAIRQA